MSDTQTEKPMSDAVPDCEASIDDELTSRAVAGDGPAVETLLRHHQRQIFTLALYMLQSRADAEDATQEILLKIALGLPAFRRLSTTRTWVTRIAVNHLLAYKRSRPEAKVTSFACFSRYLAAASELDLPNGLSAETAVLVEEARSSCTMGMLLCLDREQRVVFLLGEILETPDVIAADALQLTRENFRQRLSCAREQLSNFMRGKCGLVDPRNPCRCARKTAAFIRDGIVDPSKLQFIEGRVERARESSVRRGRALKVVQSQTFEHRRELYPLFDPTDLAARLRGLIEGEPMRTLLNLEGD